MHGSGLPLVWQYQFVVITNLFAEKGGKSNIFRQKENYGIKSISVYHCHFRESVAFENPMAALHPLCKIWLFVKPECLGQTSAQLRKTLPPKIKGWVWYICDTSQHYLSVLFVCISKVCCQNLGGGASCVPWYWSLASCWSRHRSAASGDILRSPSSSTSPMSLILTFLPLSLSLPHKSQCSPSLPHSRENPGVSC